MEHLVFKMLNIILSKDRYNGKGDVPNDKGLYVFPGNLNVIDFKLKSNLNIIEETKGLVP